MILGSHKPLVLSKTLIDFQMSFHFFLFPNSTILLLSTTNLGIYPAPQDSDPPTFSVPPSDTGSGGGASTRHPLCWNCPLLFLCIACAGTSSQPIWYSLVAELWPPTSEKPMAAIQEQFALPHARLQVCTGVQCTTECAV